MKESLTQRLLAAAPVAAICGDRINWGLNPQGSARPCVRLTQVSNPRRYHLKGETNLYAARVQVDCFGDSYTTADALRTAIIADLSAQGWDLIRVVFIIDERDGTHATAPNPVFHVITDLRVVYKGA